MESTLSSNGANGATATHSLADPAAERTLDTILATPFAEVDPPTELPPAADIEPEPPPAGDPFPLLPTPETTEPGAEPPAEETAAPAAEAQPKPETPEPKAPAAEPVAEPTSTQEKLKATITLEYQPSAFVVFRGKPVEITATHNEDTFFDGHYVTIDKSTGRIIEGTKIENQPTAQLEPLRNATSLLRLRKGLMLRALEVLDAMTVALGKELEQVDTCIETLAHTKTAIRDMLPGKSKDLIF